MEIETLITDILIKLSPGERIRTIGMLIDAVVSTAAEVGGEISHIYNIPVKTVISSLIDAGMNINTIREMVGHADERTTMNSYCYDRRTKDERIEILDKALSS